MSYFNFLSKTTDKIPPQDICRICFQDGIPPQKEPSAIIVSADLFGIEGLLPTTFQAALDFPNTPIIIAGDKSRFYKRIFSFGTAAMIAWHFAKATGLSRRFTFKYPENIMIKNMLSEKGWAYFNARDRFNMSILKFSKILTVGGMNAYDSMMQAKQCLQENGLSDENVLLIAPAHANRTYLTAQHAFAKSEVAFMPYVWQSEGLSLTPGLISEPQPSLTLKQQFAVRMAKKVLRGEVQKILQESQKGHLTLPPDITEIYGKYLRTSVGLQRRITPDKSAQR